MNFSTVVSVNHVLFDVPLVSIRSTASLCEISGTTIEELFIVDGQGMDDKYADSSAIGYPYWKPIRSTCF